MGWGVAGSVIAAVAISASGSFVTLRVMEADLDRAKADLVLERTRVDRIRDEHEAMERSVAAIQAERAIEGQMETQRWNTIQAELRQIRTDQREILVSLPSSWRERRPTR